MKYSTYSAQDRHTQRMTARPSTRAMKPTVATADADRAFRATLVLFALVLAALAALAGFAASAHAQATRMDAVFERLRTTNDVGEAKRLEQIILEEWNHSGDAAVDSIFVAGNSALEKGDLDLAFGSFDEVVRRAPSFAEGYNKRANVHYLRGDFDAAMRDVSRTLELERRHYGALLGLGMIFEANKSDDLAIRMFETALAINPNVEWAREKLRQLRDKRGIRLT